MGWRLWIIGALVVALALPAPAMASHMGQYVYYPTSHDVLGTVREPDFATTSVLGPSLTNCVVDLPLGGDFSGRCGDDALKTGLGDTLAPGCTGADEGGAPVARTPGQCGLWTVGLRPQSNVAIPPGTVPPPISELGMGAGAWPGRYAGTVRFLDGSLDEEATQNPGGLPGTNVLALNRYLADAGAGPWILPGSNMLWAWMGDWTDRNGNGVVDACYASCSAAEANEFVWRGGCVAFGPAPNAVFAVTHGYCAQDPNPNAPGSRACDVANGEDGPCAKARIDVWIFPGNHNPGFATDTPGEQLVDFVLRGLDCSTPPTCDDDSTGCEDLCSGDPLFDDQNYITPDGLTMDDRTGDDGAANAGDDGARQWSGNLGNVGTYYGDDGLLETEVIVYGANCAVGTATGLDLATPAGTDGGCTFLDVDKYPTVNPTVQSLLIGTDSDDPANPTGGLKGFLRGAYHLLGGCACGFFYSELARTIDSVENSRTVYGATLGPQQGAVDDVLFNSGWSREPNSAPQTYRDAAGVAHTVSEAYPGVAYASCDAVPVGDARNPTPDVDPVSFEDQFRGFCNVGPSGLGSAYRPYEEHARGWIDLQPIRILFHGTPITITPPCTYCAGAPFIGINTYPEPAAGSDLDPSRHARTLGPGNYFFRGLAGTWRDAPFQNDETIMPIPPPLFEGVPRNIVTYAPDHWVGATVRVSGQYHYRDFLPIVCTTEKDAALSSSPHEAAECNPYLDGNVQDPQDDVGNQEFGREAPLACAPGGMTLAPLDGVLDTQIVVIRGYNSEGFGPLLPTPHLPVVDVYGPGPVDALVSSVSCFGGVFVADDEIVWPAGNLGDDMLTSVTLDIPLGADVDGDGVPDTDRVTDVDVYAAWGAPGV